MCYGEIRILTDVVINTGPFGIVIMVVHLPDPVLYGINQAKNFRNSMLKWNEPAIYGWGELPPAIDPKFILVRTPAPISNHKYLVSVLSV